MAKRNIRDWIKFDRPSLLACEDKLCGLLRPFAAFKGHALYFPEQALENAEFLAKEKVILAPVTFRGKNMAALRLDGASLRGGRKILGILPDIIALCLENIALEAASNLDSVTGLWSEIALLENLSMRMDSDQNGSGLRQGCIGFVVLAWPDADAVAKRAGPATAALIWEKMADQLRENLPCGAVCGVLGRTEWRHEFGIILGATGRGVCHGLAARLMEKLELLEIADPFSGGRIPLVMCGGHSLFPQDMRGGELRSPGFEPGAFTSGSRAFISSSGLSAQRQAKALAFGWLCKSGGVITRILPDRRLQVSLGQASLARKGMRFHVVAPGGGVKDSKGQIILSRVGGQDSLATIFYWERDEDFPAPGDQLLLIEDGAAKNGPLLSHGSFLNFLRSSSDAKFCVAISRFSSGQDADLALFLRQTANWLGNASQAVAGYYGATGLAFYLPGAEEQDARKLAAELGKKAEESGFSAATGIFAYPCLQFSRLESEECALKALEYAELLPPPHIGALDALALTISADKRFSQGDEVGALAEYRLALLLKPQDAMILNSLGVCLAALGRLEEAGRIFLEALDNCAEKSLEAQICYNLGNMYNHDQDLANARIYFRRCIHAQNDHIFSWLRLGQIHAKTGHSAAAKALYSHAGKLAGDDAATLNMVERHLAKLEAETSQLDKARERLHDSLLRDPSDAATMLLLAKTYLADDPSMAEILARKCLRLGADAFALLADALAAQGRQEESRMARLRGQR